VASALAAVYPPLVWICAYVFSETLYSLLALLAAHVLQRAVETRRLLRRTAGQPGVRMTAMTVALLAGALTGLAILTRPAMLLFLPLALVWLVSRRRAPIAVAFVAAAALVVTPWTIRNVRVHGRFVLVASEGGVTFWTGNHPLAIGEGDLAANAELKRAELEFRRAHPGLTSEELEPLYYQDAFRAIAEDPLRWAGLMARKMFYTVAPVGPSYTLHSMRYRVASALSYLVLLPPAIVGFRRLWRAGERPTAVLLLGASAILVGLVFFPQERFRIPVIDPVLIIAASAAIAAAIRAEDGAAA
jgi:4-amino-4-deoxy-L-arabinose transferase-like glycosyltransferase